MVGPVRPWPAPWMAIAIGLPALAGAVARRARGPRSRRPLGSPGLAEPEPAGGAVRHGQRGARGAARGGRGRCSACAGVFALGMRVGRRARMRGSTARCSPRSRRSASRSRARCAPTRRRGARLVSDARRHASSSGDGGAWTLRESVWLSGDGDRRRGPGRRGPAWKARLRVPDDPGFLESLRHRGHGGRAARRRCSSASGASPNPFVRATQVFRSFVGRSIARLFPPKEAGLLLGLALGDDSQLDPGLARDFQATGPRTPARRVGRERRDGARRRCWGSRMVLRLTRWPRFGSGLGTVVFFVVLTGAEPSVMRAGVMATLTLVGRADRPAARRPARSWRRRAVLLVAGPVAGVGDRLPALGDGDRRHGGDGDAARASGSGGSCRRRSRSRPAPRSPRSSASRRSCCSISTRCRA